jgi:hypothetical protein
MDSATTFTITTLAQHFGFDSKEATSHVAQFLIEEAKEKIRELEALVLPPKEEEKEEEKEVVSQPIPDEPIPAEPKSAEPIQSKGRRDGTSIQSEGRRDGTSLPKAAFPLPWCNKVLPDRCEAIVKNYELYTQCMSAPAANSKFCKKCAKEASDEGLPKFGFAQDRVNKPNWQTPQGKTPLRYVRVWNTNKALAKAGVTRTQVEEEAAKFGLVVPADQWTKPERRSRSRKPKSPIADSSDSESEPESAGEAPPKTPTRKTKPVSPDAPKRVKANADASTPERKTKPVSPNAPKRVKANADASTPERKTKPVSPDAPKKAEGRSPTSRSRSSSHKPKQSHKTWLFAVLLWNLKRIPMTWKPKTKQMMMTTWTRHSQYSPRRLRLHQETRKCAS